MKDQTECFFFHLFYKKRVEHGARSSINIKILIFPFFMVIYDD